VIPALSTNIRLAWKTGQGQTQTYFDAKKKVLSDWNLANVWILYCDRSNFTSGRQIFREAEGDGVIGKSRRVVVQVENCDADVNHWRHFRNTCIVSLDHEIVVLSTLAIQRALGPDDAGNGVDGESSFVVRFPDKPVKKKEKTVLDHFIHFVSNKKELYYPT